MTRLTVLLIVLPVVVWMGCGGDSGGGPDTTGPSVASVSPTNGATGVALGADVVVAFSEPIDPASVSGASVQLQLGAFNVPAVITLEGGNRQVRFNPTSSLGNNGGYALTVSNAITDVAGNALTPAPFLSGFTTATATASVADGTGDTFGAGAFQADVTTFSASQGSITFVIQFSSTISPASAGAANSVGGYLDIDADQDFTTGFTPNTDVFRPGTGSTGMGAEFVVFLFDNGNGTVSVFDAVTEVGTVPVTFGTTSMTFTVPQSLLGNDDGNVNVAAVLGSLSEPTDIAPNNGHVTLGVSGLPAPPPAATLRRALANSVVPRWGS
ncbi:MAG: Ig-like domain-containing protein [Gemmatimonadales bacterium]